VTRKGRENWWPGEGTARSANMSISNTPSRGYISHELHMKKREKSHKDGAPDILSWAQPEGLGHGERKGEVKKREGKNGTRRGRSGNGRHWVMLESFFSATLHRAGGGREKKKKEKESTKRRREERPHLCPTTTRSTCPTEKGKKRSCSVSAPAVKSRATGS